MKKIDLEESKALQVSILEHVHNYCKDNNLRYALAYGALIGAVRHGGFIPWDDDIDLIMPRDDYEFFLKNYHDESGRYKVHSLNNDSKHILPFAKVEDSKTMLIEKSSNNNYLGISIDVLPVDFMGVDLDSSRMIVKSLRWLKRLYKGKLVKPNKRNSLFKKIGIIGVKFIGLPFSLRFLATLIDKKCSSIGKPDAQYMGCLCWGYEEREIMPQCFFNEFTTIKFEGREFCTIKEWDVYLSNLYGKYMELPPENKRYSPHEIINIYWR